MFCDCRFQSRASCSGLATLDAAALVDGVTAGSQRAFQSSKLRAPPFIRLVTRLVQTNLITRASL